MLNGKPSRRQSYVYACNTSSLSLSLSQQAVEVRAAVCVWCVLCGVAREFVLGGPASEARVVRTFSANDAAYLTLSRAVSQLRRCESVLGGGGLLSCVCGGFSNERWVTAEFHSLSLNA